MLELNHTIDQMDLIDFYGIFHSTSTQHTQQPMELSPKLIISSDIKQASVNIRK
jgi:hypothetical protein